MIHKTSEEIEIPLEDWERVKNLSENDVMEGALSDPDAQPLSPERLKQFQPAVNVRKIRETLKMTRDEFADTFHISLIKLKDWEEKRSIPDSAASNFLRVIQYDSETVKKALNPFMRNEEKLEQLDQDFQNATDYVLNKNRELYQRLA